MIQEVLWNLNIQASILIVTVLVLRFLFGKLPKKYTCFLWMLVLIRLLCPIFVESNLSLQPNLISGNTQEKMHQMMQQQVQEEPTFENVDMEIPVNFLQQEPQVNTGIQDNGEAAEYSKPSNVTRTSTISRQQILLVVWIAGMLILILYYTGQYMSMRRRLCTSIRMEGMKEVWQSENIQSPFVMGFLKPQIYVPYTLGEKELACILAHERMHIRHKDSITRIFLILAVCIHWWNPFVWLFCHFFNQDMEMYCDEEVLKNTDLEGKKEYSRVLLSFSARYSGLGIIMGFGVSNTKKRVEHVLHLRKPAVIVSVVAIVVIAACAVCFLTVPKKGPGENASDDEFDKDKSIEENIFEGRIVCFTYKDFESGNVIEMDLDQDGTLERIWIDHKEEVMDGGIIWSDLYYVRINDEVVWRGFETKEEVAIYAFAVDESGICLGIVSSSTAFFGHTETLIYVYDEGYVYNAGFYMADISKARLGTSGELGTYCMMSHLPWQREVQMTLVREEPTHQIKLAGNAAYLDYGKFDMRLLHSLYVHEQPDANSSGYYMDPQLITLCETDMNGWVHIQGQYYVQGWVKYNLAGGLADEANENIEVPFEILRDDIKDSKAIFYEDAAEFQQFEGNLADLKDNAYGINVDLDNDEMEDAIYRVLDGNQAYYRIELTRGESISTLQGSSQYLPVFVRGQLEDGRIGIICKFYSFADPNGGLKSEEIYIKTENGYERVDVAVKEPEQSETDNGVSLMEEYYYAVEYTGYLDEPQIQDNMFLTREAADYDGDGGIDRIYRKVQGENVSYRIEFSDGNELLLPLISKYFFYGVRQVELCGDEQKELLVTAVSSMSTNPGLVNLALYRKEQGKYVAMEVPQYEAYDTKEIGYEIYYEKLDDNKARIYNDACGFSYIMEQESWMTESSGKTSVHIFPWIHCLEWKGKTVLCFSESMDKFSSVCVDVYVSYESGKPELLDMRVQGSDEENHITIEQTDSVERWQNISAGEMLVMEFDEQKMKPMEGYDPTMLVFDKIPDMDLQRDGNKERIYITKLRKNVEVGDKSINNYNIYIGEHTASLGIANGLCITKITAFAINDNQVYLGFVTSQDSQTNPVRTFIYRYGTGKFDQLVIQDDITESGIEEYMDRIRKFE